MVGWSPSNGILLTRFYESGDMNPLYLKGNDLYSLLKYVKASVAFHIFYYKVAIDCPITA